MLSILDGHIGFLSLTIVQLVVLAQASSVDPTDISNWPSCAQICIPKGFGPSTCESLADVECICTNPGFTLAIADCEISSCILPERFQLGRLTEALCAPVGGTGPAVSSAVANYFATNTLPTLPATPVLALATTTPTGDPRDINLYPQCAQTCNEQVATENICTNQTDYTCLCAPEYRSRTAACEFVTCNISDYNAIQDLAVKLCGSQYLDNAALSASVGSAIASATAAAGTSVRAAASVSAFTTYSNASVTPTAGSPTPSAFTGAANFSTGATNGALALLFTGFLGILLLAL